jgi:uncharacterized protein Yka (UPF0111/DUF47 family)
MQKTEALSALGQTSLLFPAWIKAALAANDRLKVCLSILQAAATHADHPEGGPMSLDDELAAAGLDLPWLRGMPLSATVVEGQLVIPDCERLTKMLSEDLRLMAKPVEEADGDGDPLSVRAGGWVKTLAEFRGQRLTQAQLRELTSGDRDADAASLHVLVMDLHRRINQMAGSLSNDEVDGAHVWQIDQEDRSRVAAFMRGLNRTAPLSFDHPGLGTAATRDGTRLLLQNDIGENDVHVLVVQVEGRTVTLRYSDLHRVRFEFFQSLLQPYGARWGNLESKIEARLNEGDAFTFVTAWFECADDAALDATLEGIGSRIVFLIDWNRARKRLLPFVGKNAAITILQDAAHYEYGHRAWLQAGGEFLIYDAMQAAGPGAFRIGDRLDTVLGETDAHDFLLDVMRVASRALRRSQHTSVIADEVHLLLDERVKQHSNKFDLLDEHAGYCHALAAAVSDALARDSVGDQEEATALAARAKVWERQADHLVMQAREQGKRQPAWRPFGRIVELSDDIADDLEDAAYLISLIAGGHQQGWHAEVRQSLCQLADEVLAAMQEHIKALAIARSLSVTSDAGDGDAFVAASWNVLYAERKCDELFRQGRRILLDTTTDAATLILTNDLASTLESASDRLLAAGYALREVAFTQTEAR